MNFFTLALWDHECFIQVRATCFRVILFEETLATMRIEGPVQFLSVSNSIFMLDQSCI